MYSSTNKVHLSKCESNWNQLICVDNIPETLVPMRFER